MSRNVAPFDLILKRSGSKSQYTETAARACLAFPVFLLSRVAVLKSIGMIVWRREHPDIVDK